jgi:hypothetical protein
VKVVFDENFSPRGVEHLRGLNSSFLRTPLEITYLPELLRELGHGDGRGVRDETWGPIVQRLDRAVVVTFDHGRGRDASLGKPLPIVLPQCGVTGFWLPSTLCQRPVLEKVVVAAALLPLIETTAEKQPAGTRFRVTRETTIALKLWPMKPES